MYVISSDAFNPWLQAATTKTLNVSLKKGRKSSAFLHIHPFFADHISPVTSESQPPVTKDEVVEVPQSLKGIPETAPGVIIQIWEGTVLSVDEIARSMEVELVDRSDVLSPHVAEISLTWVDEQDLDLVEPGAVFYWTLFRELKHGSVRNTQEIRFRRLPNWTKAQLAHVAKEAKTIRAKAGAPRKLAE